ncbi:ADP-heptose:LPS heptosyltransferase [Mucilaginibacter gossypiicola]|uniref:ADP-heptose:LPS heptosyltransferase n=1 Tax=Mucilaginibacter gossypiicola TaxID=551995 RepID=A0A1H8RKH5_9SPHI|nr:glycosyltransferase family 9 protein [Mucilaginibacter gossypiicola]SEO66684.1 ADP-heptose:LPS heptosyltransferase [Mucilaginibacter gossypiicola]
MQKNRNLFRITRFILLKAPYIFRFFALFRSPKKRILIIKADAIGDYILFRNFIEIVKHSAKYYNYEIDLLGNEIWSDLATTHDGKYVKKFFFTKANSLYHSPKAVFKLGWQLLGRNYEAVLNPSSTRTFITDGLAALSGTSNLIGFKSDTEGIEPKYKAKTDKFYKTLLPIDTSVHFEFARNRYFFEQVLNQPLNIQKQFISANRVKRSGIIIFPGAGLKNRGWEADKFAGLIKKLEQNTGEIIYLAGGHSEITLCNYILEKSQSASVANISGKTSLTELIDLVANSAMVICNDSSAVHIAAAVDTPFVCIVGGGHFNRFVPYPAGTVKNGVFIYEKMDCYYCNWNCVFKIEDGQCFPCIAGISIENVWQAAQKRLTIA